MISFDVPRFPPWKDEMQLQSHLALFAHIHPANAIAFQMRARHPYLFACEIYAPCNMQSFGEMRFRRRR